MPWCAPMKKNHNWKEKEKKKKDLDCNSSSFKKGMGISLLFYGMPVCFITSDVALIS